MFTQCCYPFYTDLGHGNFEMDRCPNEVAEDSPHGYCDMHKLKLQTDFLEPPQTADGKSATHRTRG